jgi:nucleotide-binding universal stress UspA family protein
MEYDRKADYYPEPWPMSAEERAAALAKLKANFTAADLQRFTEVEEGIPLEEIIKELEEIDRSMTQETA